MPLISCVDCGALGISDALDTNDRCPRCEREDPLVSELRAAGFWLVRRKGLAVSMHSYEPNSPMIERRLCQRAEKICSQWLSIRSANATYCPGKYWSVVVEVA